MRASGLGSMPLAHRYSTRTGGFVSLSHWKKGKPLPQAQFRAGRDGNGVVMREHTFRILLVEDNPGDARLAHEALQEGSIPADVHFASDGNQALEFLRRTGSFANVPRPDLVLLDLNMPRKDGREVLAEMKADPDLRRIPVVVLTTSEAERDVLQSYNLHANGYVVKPLDLDQFFRIFALIKEFWLGAARLPRS
jgi:CheY-like chemotaxis protein